MTSDIEQPGGAPRFVLITAMSKPDDPWHAWSTTFDALHAALHAVIPARRWDLTHVFGPHGDYMPPSVAITCSMTAPEIVKFLDHIANWSPAVTHVVRVNEIGALEGFAGATPKDVA